MYKYLRRYILTTDKIMDFSIYDFYNNDQQDSTV